MPDIWFTSDIHYGHANIIKYCNRPFSDSDEMNRECARRWNAIVKPNDIVYYVGDFSLSTWVMETVAPLLNGHKTLIVGNHDKAFPTYKRFKEFEQIYRKYFENVVMEMVIKVDNLVLKLNHLPYTGPPPPIKDKYAKFRPKHEEEDALIHGHIHNSSWIKKGRMINVSSDAWDFYPIGLPKIKELIESQTDIYCSKPTTYSE